MAHYSRNSRDETGKKIPLGWNALDGGWLQKLQMRQESQKSVRLSYLV